MRNAHGKSFSFGNLVNSLPSLFSNLRLIMQPVQRELTENLCCLWRLEETNPNWHGCLWSLWPGIHGGRLTLKPICSGTAHRRHCLVKVLSDHARPLHSSFQETPAKIMDQQSGSLSITWGRKVSLMQSYCILIFNILSVVTNSPY